MKKLYIFFGIALSLIFFGIKDAKAIYVETFEYSPSANCPNVKIGYYKYESADVAKITWYDLKIDGMTYVNDFFRYGGYYKCDSGYFVNEQPNDNCYFCKYNGPIDGSAHYEMDNPVEGEDQENQEGQEETNFTFCQQSTLKVFKIVGIIIALIKLIIPLLLLIMGSLDFGKAMMASDQNAITDSSIILVKRIVASLIIFFIPTVLNFIFSMVYKLGDEKNMADFKKCTDCMFDVDKC